MWQPIQRHCNIQERLTPLFKLRSKMSRKKTCASRDYEQLTPITHETGSTVVQQWSTVATIWVRNTTEFVNLQLRSLDLPPLDCRPFFFFFFLLLFSGSLLLLLLLLLFASSAYVTRVKIPIFPNQSPQIQPTNSEQWNFCWISFTLRPLLKTPWCFEIDFPLLLVPVLLSWYLHNLFYFPSLQKSLIL